MCQYLVLVIKLERGSGVRIYSAILYVVSECLLPIGEKNWDLTSRDNGVGEG